MDKKYQVIALMGKAGAGKDTVQNAVCTAHPLMFHKIISCTTRPIRENEKDGVDYHYIALEDFTRQVLHNEMLEATEFRDWFYGTPLTALSMEKINIGVFNPAGVRKLLADERLNVKVVEIQAPDKERLLLYLTREEHPDCAEMCRRYFTDNEDFKGLEFDYFIAENWGDASTDIINEEHSLFPYLEDMWNELDPGTAFETIVRWEKTMATKTESEDDKDNID